MLDKKTQAIVLLLLILLITTLALAACSAVDEDDLSRESGQKVRQQVDQLLDQIGEFVAGFCAPSALTVVLVMMEPASCVAVMDCSEFV